MNRRDREGVKNNGQGLDEGTGLGTWGGGRLGMLERA